jgi:hypothetical protein
VLIFKTTIFICHRDEHVVFAEEPEFEAAAGTRKSDR